MPPGTKLGFAGPPVVGLFVVTYMPGTHDVVLGMPVTIGDPPVNVPLDTSACRPRGGVVGSTITFWLPVAVAALLSDTVVPEIPTM